jgi:HTH-type transcriptional regulator / antitoxin HigA
LKSKIFKAFKPADVFPPGLFIQEELTARGWTQADLARVLGRPLQSVNMIVNGKKRITAETAKALGLAFGTGPELWVNLEAAHQLHIAKEPDPLIAQRVSKMGVSKVSASKVGALKNGALQLA